MNDLTARLLMVAEMDNEQYGRLRQQEEQNYRRWAEEHRIRKHSFPTWHWTDGQLVASFAPNVKIWPPAMTSDQRQRSIRDFEAEVFKLVYANMIADFRREGDPQEYAVEQTQEACHTGWLMSQPLCHKIDAIVRASAIQADKGGGRNAAAGAHLSKAQEEAARLRRQYEGDVSGGTFQPEPPEPDEPGGHLVLPC